MILEKDKLLEDQEDDLSAESIYNFKLQSWNDERYTNAVKQKVEDILKNYSEFNLE